jgi:hypothetical protein
VSERFLSEEDLDLANLSWEELLAWWELWLRQAQATNDDDEHLYSHGVFRVEPGWRIGPGGVEREPKRDESSA